MAEGGGRLSPSRIICLAAVLATCGSTAADARLRTDLRGAELYARECAPCHGTTGRGDGPEAVYFAPPPRNLNEGFLSLYETDELIARIRTGEALTIEIDKPALRRRTSVVDAILAHVRRLPDVQWDAAQRGADLYSERCESCHGSFGRPGNTTHPWADGQATRALDDPAFQKSVGDPRLLEMARHRSEGLPPLPPLGSKEEGRALLAYLRLLSPGFELYSLWCAGCHGDDGSGDGELAEGPDQPDVVFDRAYLQSRTPEMLREQVMHMLDSQEGAMPHLQHRLDDAQLRSVIDYLRRTDKSPRPSPIER